MHVPCFKWKMPDEQRKALMCPCDFFNYLPQGGFVVICLFILCNFFFIV